MQLHRSIVSPKLQESLKHTAGGRQTTTLEQRQEGRKQKTPEDLTAATFEPVNGMFEINTASDYVIMVPVWDSRSELLDNFSHLFPTSVSLFPPQPALCHTRSHFVGVSVLMLLILR